MSSSDKGKGCADAPDLPPRGSTEQEQGQQAIDSIDPAKFQDLPEDDAMSKAIAESMEEAKRVEIETHKYDEWQTGDQEWKYEEEVSFWCDLLLCDPAPGTW